MRHFHLQIVAKCAWKGQCECDAWSVQLDLCVHRVMKRCTSFCLSTTEMGIWNYGYFQAIPPTITLDDNGTMQTTCKFTVKWIGVNESDILFNTYNNIIIIMASKFLYPVIELLFINTMLLPGAPLKSVLKLGQCLWIHIFLLVCSTYCWGDFSRRYTVIQCATSLHWHYFPSEYGNQFSIAWQEFYYEPGSTVHDDHNVCHYFAMFSFNIIL